MPDALILREDRDAVATLTLNAPASLNALSVPMLRAMEVSLSRNRQALHKQIDLVTTELIARYRTNPALALTALPVRHR